MIFKFKGKEVEVPDNFLILCGQHAQQRGMTLEEYIAEAFTKIYEENIRGKIKDVIKLLEDKKIKWAFKHAERTGAKRLVLLAPDEWSRKMIKVKDLETGEEKELSLKDL